MKKVILFFCCLQAYMAEAPGSLLSAQVASSEIGTLVEKMISDDSKKQASAIKALALTGEPQVARVLELFRQGAYHTSDGVFYVFEQTIEDEDFNEFGLLLNPLNGNPLMDENGDQQRIDVFDVDEVEVTRAVRIQVRRAEVLLRLSSRDGETRLAAVKKCAQPPRQMEAMPFLLEMSLNEPDSKIRHAARESVLLMQVTEENAEQDQRSKALIALGAMKSLRAAPVIEEMLLLKSELPASLVSNCEDALAKIHQHQWVVNRMGSVIQGISLGSVLVLMALGLAITFGLMGVINMAHGEMMMIGAYATFEMQRIFQHTGSSPNNWYYVAALPVSFLAAALVGVVVEFLVVRHLYRRPLESLLATWGVGLILIQLVRVRYGDNIGINAPTWARGGVEVMQDVIVPYARIFILFLCAGCIGFIYWLMNKTNVGLRIRAVMQNRDMANTLGVNTKKVDLYTFALGSGIAGIAGYAWTMIGGVTPDMGQQIFIVDSFLVVVTGGVGELAGVIWSGMGIGVISKLIEPLEIGDWTFGPVWAKVALLAIIVAFIQFKPAGLFAGKGRADDR
ncbi:MAG: urea ABC transporter permease subunit UrtB [Verrucomicrobiota bacterium]|nr:urea ABC transporter permease subunit UrtB [Verrucomicrobiota bacterium]